MAQIYITFFSIKQRRKKKSHCDTYKKKRVKLYFIRRGLHKGVVKAYKSKCLGMYKNNKYKYCEGTEGSTNKESKWRHQHVYFPRGCS